MSLCQQGSATLCIMLVINVGLGGMLMVYKTDMQGDRECLFAELFHSLFSLEDKLNVAQSVIIYFYIMSISIDVYGEGGVRPIWRFPHPHVFPNPCSINRLSILIRLWEKSVCIIQVLLKSKTQTFCVLECWKVAVTVSTSTALTLLEERLFLWQ